MSVRRSVSQRHKRATRRVSTVDESDTETCRCLDVRTRTRKAAQFRRNMAGEVKMPTFAARSISHCRMQKRPASQMFPLKPRLYSCPPKPYKATIVLPFSLICSCFCSPDVSAEDKAALSEAEGRPGPLRDEITAKQTLV